MKKATRPYTMTFTGKVTGFTTACVVMEGIHGREVNVPLSRIYGEKPGKEDIGTVVVIEIPGWLNHRIAPFARPQH